MKEFAENSIHAWIDQLIVQGYLSVSDGEYPLLQVTHAGLDLCKKIGIVNLGRPAPMARKTKASRRGSPTSKTDASESLDPKSTPLFETLRRLRLLLARKQGVPPYLVFPDTVLTSLAISRPTGLGMMRRIKGIGEIKLARYGQAFLRVLSGGSPETVAEEFRSMGPE